MLDRCDVMEENKVFKKRNGLVLLFEMVDSSKVKFNINYNNHSIFTLICQV